MLLDSQTVWWLLTEDRPIGKSLLQKLNRHHIAFFSPATVFEFFQKSRKGKLRVPENLVELIRQMGLQELQISAEHASDSRFISPEIYDPFDRMLLAQAQHEKIDFFTSDKKILSLGLDFVKDASL
jgi:PIN domain nuclease of toxin-antitoxin system